MASNNAPQMPQDQSSGTNQFNASAQKQNVSNGPITSATGRSTVFGLNYDQSIDTQDNGQGFFADPSTGKPYDTRNPNLVGFSLPISVVNSTIGNRWDGNTQQAISSGKYKVQATASNGKTVTGPLVDVGPAAWTGNAIDTTLGAANALGLKDNSRLTYSIIGPDGKTVPIKGNTADPNAPISTGGGLTRSYYTNMAMQRWNVEHSPFNLGMSVATPDELDRYEAYLNQGGDPNQIPANERVGLALAKDPKFLTRDEAYPVWKELVWDPQQKKDLGQQVQEGIQSIPGMIASTVDNLGASYHNATASVNNGVEYLWNKLTGSTWNTEGKPNFTLTQDLANNIATNTQGTADGVKGIADFLDGTVNFVGRAVQNTVQNAINDPLATKMLSGQAPAANNEADARNAFQLMQRASGRADWAKNAINTVAAGYNAVGQKDLSNDIQNGVIDPKAAAGTSLVFQTLAPGPLLDAAGAGVAGLIRPSYVGDAVNSLGNVTKAEAVLQDATKGVQNARQAMGVAAPGPEFLAAKDAHDVATAVFDDAKATYTQANADANSAINAFSKQAGPGAAQTVVGVGSKLAGQGATILGKFGKAVGDMPDAIASKVSGGNPLIQGVVSQAIDKGIDVALFEHFGAAGVAAKFVVKHADLITNEIAPPLQAIGKELLTGESSLPFFRRVSQELGPTTGGWIAKQLDRPSIYALGNVAGTVGNMASGAAKNAIVGAVLGGVSNPINPVQSAIQGSAFGGIYGMAGAGMAQWRKFNSPEDALRASYGDLSRFQNNKLAPSQKSDFAQLSLPDQIKISQISQAHPDVLLNFYNRPGGESGFHQVDANGKSIANINVSGDNPLAPMVAHEVLHSMARSGDFNKIYDAVLGNSATGKTGTFTKLDAQGNPVIGSDGEYQLNNEFYDHKISYQDKLSSLGEDPTLSDKEFAQELYAEHGADYLMSGSHILDSTSTFNPGMFTSADGKEMLGKLGYTFNRTGQVVGTGLFSGLKSEDTFSNLTKSYYKSLKGWKIDENDIKGPGMITQDEINKDPTILARKVRGGYLQTDAYGNVTGLKKESQVNKESMAFTNFVHEALDKESQSYLDQYGIQRRLDPISKQNVYESRYFPEGLLNDALDHINASQHYRDQVLTVNRSLSDPDQAGNILNFGYWKALSKSKKYGSFPYEIREAVPYQLSMTKNQNLIMKTADIAQLSRNYSMVRDRPDFKGIWRNLDEFSKDAHRYFTNLSDGQPGASNGLGETKRDLINSLLGLSSKENAAANPLSGELPKKSQPFIKSFRLDRMSNVSWRGSLYPFKSLETYNRANRNFRP